MKGGREGGRARCVASLFYFFSSFEFFAFRVHSRPNSRVKEEKRETCKAAAAATAVAAPAALVAPAAALAAAAKRRRRGKRQ